MSGGSITSHDIRALAKAAKGATLTTQATAERGSGSLVARRLSKNIGLYYQYRHEGKQHRIPLGAFDERGDNSGKADADRFSLNGAKKRAATLAHLAHEHGDLIGYLREQRLANTKAIAKAGEERQAGKRHSLERLCTAYADHLKAQGKPSARTVENALNRWVVQAHPELAGTRASDITPDDVMVILRTIIEAGHTTITNRVRSHLSAAYGFGIGSVTNPLLAHQSDGFRLTVNPVAGIKPVAEFENTSERVLSDTELTGLLTRLEQCERPKSRCALLALRLGGQRLSQLLEVESSDIDLEAGTMMLWDSKGRRAKPRAHLLPIDGIDSELIAALAQWHPRNSGAFAGLSMHTVSTHIRAIGTEVSDTAFTWRDVRRTVETRLAAMGISSDTRAELLSHGLSGIQKKSYDRHSYTDEKRSALKAWNDRLDALLTDEPIATNVVGLHRG